MLIQVLIAMAIMMAVESALRQFAGYAPHALRPLFIYLAAFAVVAIVASRRKARRAASLSTNTKDFFTAIGLRPYGAAREIIGSLTTTNEATVRTCPLQTSRF
jgi:hypothetical protein